MDFFGVENLEKQNFHHITSGLCYVEYYHLFQRPSLTQLHNGAQAPRRGRSRCRGQRADPASHLSLPHSSPSLPLSSRVRMGSSTFVRKASQARPKMWQVCHCLCYLGHSSPALRMSPAFNRDPRRRAPGPGLRLDSEPPTLTGTVGPWTRSLTVLHTSVPYLWGRCYLSYWVARRIKWVNVFAP